MTLLATTILGISLSLQNELFIVNISEYLIWVFSFLLPVLSTAHLSTYLKYIQLIFYLSCSTAAYNNKPPVEDSESVV